MRHSTTFVVAAVGIVLGGVLAAWPFAAARPVLGAGALALGTQLPMHFLLRPWRERGDRLAAAISVGFLARLAVLGAAVAVFVIPGRVDPAPFLLGLVGFLVAVLFAESVIEYRRCRGAAGAGAQR